MALNERDKKVLNLILDKGRNNFICFAKLLNKDLDLQNFHIVMYIVLDMFAKGLIKKLILTMPPRHGKSEASTRLLPAYILGRNPDAQISIMSYSANLAKKFNKDVKRNVTHKMFRLMFPSVQIPNVSPFTRNKGGLYSNTASSFDIIRRKGGLKVLGRGGGLTGETVDYSILDDLYKNYQEGASPTIRAQAWNTYKTVIRSRQPKQELITFTRWHEEDIIGEIEKIEQIINVTSWEQLNNIPKGAWVKINFEAIKETLASELDGRSYGTALWESRYPLDSLLDIKKLDTFQFNCLYQGKPNASEGLLYPSLKGWEETRPYGFYMGSYANIDVADEGNDKTCLVTYDLYYNQLNDYIPLGYYPLITEVYLSDKTIEHSSKDIAAILKRQKTEIVEIEKNNAGRGFSLLTKEELYKIGWKPKGIDNDYNIEIKLYNQNKNKEGRLISNAGYVSRHIRFPKGFDTTNKEAWKNISRFSRNIRSNSVLDFADVLTRIIEMWVVPYYEKIQEEKNNIRIE